MAANMTGVSKTRTYRRNPYPFHASRYDDPRGGRLSALEKNILRYRSTEQTLYLHYAQEIREFMIGNLDPKDVKLDSNFPWVTSEEKRQANLFNSILLEAERAGKVTQADALAIRQRQSDGQQGKAMKRCFTYAVSIDFFTSAEADELIELLDYRNDLAHRIHLMMADVSRDRFSAEHLEFYPNQYQGDALKKLRTYRHSLWTRMQGKVITYVSFDGLLFDAAEKTFEKDLSRLEKLISKQIKKERERLRAIQAHLSLVGSGLDGDLAPHFPPNRHLNGGGGPDSGHLTKRGVEICYRLFDLGKPPIAVAYLMGMGLQAARRRHAAWLKLGGQGREPQEIKRYPGVPRPSQQTAEV